MPVIITFDVPGSGAHDLGRIQSMFERFGWQNLGGSTYRYPRLGRDTKQQEDWLNHVIPALMLFRTYVVTSGRHLTKFTIDAHASSGYISSPTYGTHPSNEIDIFFEPGRPQFGKKKLMQWLDGIEYPYAPDSA